jgi:hypothetical protein
MRRSKKGFRYMPTKLTPLLALLALLAALLIGAAGTASATSADPEFDCVNGVSVVVCDNSIDVTVDIDVIITTTRALTSTEINLLEEALDELFQDCLTVTKNDIQVLTVDIFTNEFNITILSGNVIVIGDLPVPC